MSRGRREVRYNSDLGEFELQCPDCRDRSVASYWPLTTEYWRTASLIRCRACWRLADNRRHRQARATNPALRRKNAAQAAAWRERNPGYNVETARVWRDQHRERKRAADRARYAMRGRRLTDEQAAAISKAMRSGARAADLAAGYGVAVRTIYRTLDRVPVAA